MVLVGIFIVISLSTPSLTPNIAEASSCSVEEYTASPPSPVVWGTHVALYGRGNCSGGVRASRFEIDGQGFGEDAGATEQNETWITEEFAPGIHNVCFAIAGGPDASWEAAARECKVYQVTGGPTLTPTPSLAPPSGTQPPLPTPTQIPETDCHVEFFTANPPSPVMWGTDVLLHGKGDCKNGVRAVRFEINGVPRAEIGSPEQTETWHTEESMPGTYNVCFLVAGGTDARWEAGANSCKVYYVYTGVPPTSPPPTPLPTIGPAPTQNPGSPCQVVAFDVSPRSGQPGTTFTLSGTGTCPSGVRAVRFLIGSQPYGEFAGPSTTTTWNSSGYPNGTISISFQATAGSWDDAAISTIAITLGSAPPPQPTSTPSGSPSSVTLEAAYTTVNVRSGPGMMFNIIGSIFPGNRYPVVGKNASTTWLQISSGWVCQSVVSIYGELHAVSITDSTAYGCDSSSSTTDPPHEPEWCIHNVHTYDDWQKPIWNVRDKGYYMLLPLEAWDGNLDHIIIYFYPLEGWWVQVPEWVVRPNSDTAVEVTEENQHLYGNATPGVYYQFGISTAWAYLFPEWRKDNRWRVVTLCSG